MSDPQFWSKHVKAGDLVRVTAIPTRLPDSPETREVFARCVGHTFSVIDVRDDGQAELEVGEVMGVMACLHSIWIDPECLEPVTSSSSPGLT
jgi:hypothetical protein